MEGSEATIARRRGQAGAKRQEERIGIGRMADLNCVSVKALHVYQDRNLVSPRFVDPESGYRYYSIDQCSRIDAISHMQALGFSLGDIVDMMDAQMPHVRKRLASQMENLRRQERELAASRAMVNSLLRSCDAVEEHPRSGEISLLELPDRLALSFPVSPVPPDDVENLAWEQAVRDVKQQLVERGLPLSLFQNVSGLIAEDDLRAGDYTTRCALVFVEEEVVDALGDIEGIEVASVPGGDHLCIYHDRSLQPDGTSAEYADIARLIAYAKQHGFEIAGDYIGETLATTPLFSYEGRESLFRMLLPVNPN